MGASREQHCLELFKLDTAVLRLPDEERRKVSRAVTVHKKTGFEPNELAHSAPITLADEALVIGVLLVCMGLPLALGPALAALAYWYGVGGAAAWAACVAILALHPLPARSTRLAESRFTTALFRYFSYRFLWSGDARDACLATKPWIGAGPPHGLLPFANILSIPALNMFARPFVGASASVVKHTPGLRYLLAYGIVDVSAASIAASLRAGDCVGTVPDGIAGIFACDHSQEVVVLKHRKGLAKLALRTGFPLVPAYSIGNTEAYTAVSDHFGVMEYVSRKLRVSLVLFFGRFGLPIPRRTNVTMLIGDPILVDRVDHPTQLQIDDLHARLLDGLESVFNTHKAALGWGHKHIIFK